MTTLTLVYYLFLISILCKLIILLNMLLSHKYSKWLPDGMMIYITRSILESAYRQALFSSWFEKCLTVGLFSEPNTLFKLLYRLQSSYMHRIGAAFCTGLASCMIFYSSDYRISSFQPLMLHFDVILQLCYLTKRTQKVLFTIANTANVSVGYLHIVAILISYTPTC